MSLFTDTRLLAYSGRATAAITILLFLPLLTHADHQLNPVQKQQRYNFEQCANQCQESLDKALVACDRARYADSRKPADNCELNAFRKYENWLARCPLDPRRKD